ncbi:alpha/beta fold hydrolase [Streptomyces chartreusis]
MHGTKERSAQALMVPDGKGSSVPCSRRGRGALAEPRACVTVASRTAHERGRPAQLGGTLRRPRDLLDVSADVVARAAPNRSEQETRSVSSSMTFATYAAFLAAVVDELDAPRVHLLGHSHGGFVVQRDALEHPDRVPGRRHRVRLRRPGDSHRLPRLTATIDDPVMTFRTA